MRLRFPDQSFFTAALAVIAVDQATKYAAESWLGRVGATPIALGRAARVLLVHNAGLAFGINVGGYTWSLNVAVTVAALLLIVAVSPDLTRLDRMAAVALGLIAGAAAGNLLSLVTSPAGVVDFLAIGAPDRMLVLNAADLAAYLGIAMLVRTAWRAWQAVARNARPVVKPRVYLEREVAIIHHADGVAGRLTTRPEQPARPTTDSPSDGITAV